MCLSAFKVWAHHNASASAAGSSARGVLVGGTKLGKPESQTYLSYDMSWIDNDVGYLHTVVAGGEWAFSKRASLTTQIPVAYLKHNVVGRSVGLGDVMLGGKFLLLNTNKLVLFTSANFWFPTGDENTGLGSGKFGSQWDGFAGIRFGEWMVFAAPLVSIAFSEDPQPVVSGALGVTSPTYFKRIFFTLAAQPQVFAASSVFEDGSYKIYIEPQVGVFLDKNRKITANLAVRVSALDKITRDPSVTLTQSDQPLLNDTLWGVRTSLNYTF